jgi:hypothetical protein
MIAPTNNRLQKNVYGTGYSEFMDYSVVDALTNPGYGGAMGMPVGGRGNQDVNIDLEDDRCASESIRSKA